jgi:PAS domain S-box-containing protein
MPNSSVLNQVVRPRSPGPMHDMRADRARDALVAYDDMELITTALVENAPVAMAMFDREMRYVLANRQWIADFNLRDALPIVGRSQFELFPSLTENWRAVYERALQGHVVKREVDVHSTNGGQPTVCRWEVRPWRKNQDASVMGIMVTCEKFSRPRAAPSETEEKSDESSLRAHAAPSWEGCALPVLALDAAGRVLELNTAFVNLVGIASPDATVVERLFGDSDEPTKERRHHSFLRSLAKVIATGNAESVFTDAPAASDSVTGFSWTLSAVVGEQNTAAALLLGTPVVEVVQRAPAPFSPVADVKVEPAVSEKVVDASNATAFNAKISALTAEVGKLNEQINIYSRREMRHREILDTMPCGLIVLDERGRPIFQNAHVRQMVGRELATGGSVEDWLNEGCADEAARAEVGRVWREEIWRRQLTQIISLSTEDGFVKALEFRPRALPEGGLLLTIYDVSEQCQLEELLHAVEAKFRGVLKDCPLPLLLTDATGAVIDANPKAEAMLGMSRNELRRVGMETLLTEESVKAFQQALHRAYQAGLTQTVVPVEITTALEGLASVTVTVGIILGSNGRPHALAHFLVKKSEVEETLPLSADTLVDASASASDEVTSTWMPLLKTDSLGRIAEWNEEAGQPMMGCRGDQVVNEWLHHLFRPSDATGFYNELQALLDKAAGASAVVKWAWYGEGGRRGEAEFKVEPLPDGPCAVALSVHPLGETAASGSERTPTSFVIASGPRRAWQMGPVERERLLLTETHHRVKNHFQIISSLLNLQSNEVEHEGMKHVLRSSQNRIRALAALQQHLFDVQMGQVDGLQAFTEELIQRLRDCYEVGQDQVQIEANLQALKIRSEWFMPLALILNEVISNVFKHAFADGRSGWAKLSLTAEPDGAHLRVRDNGQGLPPHFGSPGTTGMGLRVLGIFANQLEGKVSLKNIEDGGVLFDLQFPMTCVDI